MSTPTQLPPGAPILEAINRLKMYACEHDPSLLTSDIITVSELIDWQTAETERLKALTVTLTAERDQMEKKRSTLALKLHDADCDTLIAREERDQARAQVVELREALEKLAESVDIGTDDVGHIDELQRRYAISINRLAKTAADYAGMTVIKTAEKAEIETENAQYRSRLDNLCAKLVTLRDALEANKTRVLQHATSAYYSGAHESGSQDHRVAEIALKALASTSEFAGMVAVKADELAELRRQLGPETGTGLIANERRRQIKVEGWTPEHDAKHGDGELARVAAIYALGPRERQWLGRKLFSMVWPFEMTWFKPAIDRRTDLVRAGALIAAELDRDAAMQASTAQEGT